MNIHEYQAKKLLASYGVAVLKGGVAYTPAEAEQVAEELGGPVWVVKSQIHAGGRGKGHFKGAEKEGGGVRSPSRPTRSSASPKRCWATRWSPTRPVRPARKYKRIYIEEGCDIKRELYLGMLIDRATAASPSWPRPRAAWRSRRSPPSTPGEDPARRHRSGHRHPALPRRARSPSAWASKASRSAPRSTSSPPCTRPSSSLDCSIVEINPLVVTGAGEVIALDAKMNFDDNALFRHKDIDELRDESEEDPAELEAARHQPQLHQARRQDRLHGQRRRSGHGDHGHHQALWRRAGQLPRCRRRRHQGARHHRLQADPVRPACRRHPGQHLRRHHALRRHRRRRGRRGARSQPATCRWWCVSKAPMSNWARRSWPSRACRSSPPTIWRMPPKRWSRP